MFDCGCGVTWSMFGKREWLSVSYCSIHKYLDVNGLSVGAQAEQLLNILLNRSRERI
jgi:hypothetical protein